VRDSRQNDAQKSNLCHNNPGDQNRVSTDDFVIENVSSVCGDAIPRCSTAA
jgi:hypothetical protein